MNVHSRPRHLTRVLFAAIIIAALGLSTVQAQEPDLAGSKDHPLFNRMPGFRISQYETNAFDAHPFLVNGNQVNVEGRMTKILYVIQTGATEPSRAQILRNYENAIAKIGGTVLTHDADGSSFMKVAKDGKEIWAHVDAYITSQYGLTVIEKGAMAQEITANAAAFANDIRATGHTPVYGIYFDTNKSTIKPESESAIAEIVKLLKSNPALKLRVVGHTDAVGVLEANMRLSQARADSVVQALTARGIAGARLSSHGVGSLSPVATNEDESGRAKNRRVELVKQ